MSNNLMIQVSRQQLEYWRTMLLSGLPETVASMIETVLAAPVVERQAMPIYQVRYIGDGGGGWVDVERDEFTFDKGRKDYHTRTVFDSPPAPVAVALPERMEMKPFQTVDRGSTNYKAGFNACIKQTEELNACLDKVKELNQ